MNNNYKIIKIDGCYYIDKKGVDVDVIIKKNKTKIKERFCIKSNGNWEDATLVRVYSYEIGCFVDLNVYKDGMLHSFAKDIIECADKARQDYVKECKEYGCEVL